MWKNIAENSNNQTTFEEEPGQKDNEVCIGWRNLQYKTEGWFGSGKVILNRLNGCFEYHTLNGFMGPSGAGKTTLLNCLSGNRVQGLTEDSEIYLSQDQKGGEKLVSYFIEQHIEKIIVNGMRVGHILRYAYRFKNGNKGDMERHILSTIDELLLDEKVLDRKFEQCSGGEQKRIAIAQELMSLRKPTLLFVDEPTTGLDSNAAHLVMKCLKQLATKHRMTVVTSIHVPSDDILNLFDKLYVLAKGGVCIYSGRPQQLRSHLETKIEDLVIPDQQPPIEVLIKIACAGITNHRVVTLANQTLIAEYQNVSQSLPVLELYPNGVPNHRKSFQISHFFLQTVRMFQITFISSYKFVLFQLLICIYYETFLVSLYGTDIVKPSGCYPLALNETTGNSTRCNNEIKNDSEIRQNIISHGSSLGYNAFVLACMSACLYGPIVQVFQNEHRNHWYSLGVFFSTATIVGLLQVSLYTMVYTLFSYFYSNQHYLDNYEINWTRLGYFFYFLQLLAIYMDSLGQLIGAVLLTNQELSLIIVALSSVFITIMSGSFLDLETLTHPIIKAIKDLLAISPIFKGIVNSLYGLDRCDPDQEYSLVMINYHVDPNEIPNYTRSVLTNALLIRVATIAFLYWRFNSFGRKSTRKSTDSDEMIWIDYGNKSSEVCLEMSKQQQSTTTRSKPENEIQFEKFSRGKIIVAWRDLSLFGTNLIFERTSLENKASCDKKAILKNLSGQFRFGTLNAVMGTSGSGKTSLLKVLNGRDKTRLSATTQFYLSKFTRIQTCFITQDVSGHLLPGLTAKQTLVYASRLKNAQLREFGVDTSKLDHHRIALNLLNELELSDTADTLVEKCSGGERKRLALALELTALQMPNLVCIDEPTSGLDSNSAEVVVSCLHKLTQTHSITIVASIHQPNTELLRMFDQIYVLARGGVCIYSGAPTAILSQLSTVPEISSQDTKFPIETLIKFSCLSFSDPTVHQLMTTNDIHFNQSIVDSGLLEQETQPVPDGIQQNRRRFSLEDSWILCCRYFSFVYGHLWMEWTAFLLMYFIFLAFISNLFDPSIATVSGCLNLDDDFNNSCTKTEEKIHEENLLSYNLQYTCFAFCYFLMFVLIQSSLSLMRDSIYFFNEHRNGWYSTGSFYLTKFLSAFIPLLVVILIYVYLCNIYEPILPGIYPHLVLLMILATLSFQGLSHLIGVASNGNVLILAILVSSVFMTNFLLSNFFIPLNTVHYIFRLTSKLSTISYLLDSLIVLQYGFGRCLPKQLQPVLYLFSLQDSDYYHSLIALVLLAIGFHLASIALLVIYASPVQNRRGQIQRITEHCQKLRPTNTIFPGLGSPNQFEIRLMRF